MNTQETGQPDLTPELLELATTPREAGYTAIIVQRQNDDQIIADKDVWQEWIREDRLL